MPGRVPGAKAHNAAALRRAWAVALDAAFLVHAGPAICMGHDCGWPQRPLNPRVLRYQPWPMLPLCCRLPACALQVRELVQLVRPEVVRVELCKERVGLLADPEDSPKPPTMWHSRKVGEGGRAGARPAAARGGPRQAAEPCSMDGVCHLACLARNAFTNTTGRQRCTVPLHGRAHDRQLRLGVARAFGAAKGFGVCVCGEVLDACCGMAQLGTRPGSQPPSPQPPPTP